MNRLLHYMGIIGLIIMTICDIAEFLAVPALLVIIGILNAFTWKYYVIAIGGYLVLFALIEVILYFIFKVLDKKYTPIIERKLEKFFKLS